jgi:hypothetical protein
MLSSFVVADETRLATVGARDGNVRIVAGASTRIGPRPREPAAAGYACCSLPAPIRAAALGAAAPLPVAERARRADGGRHVRRRA